MKKINTKQLGLKSAKAIEQNSPLILILKLSLYQV